MRNRILSYSLILFVSLLFSTSTLAESVDTLSKRKQWMNDLRDFKREFMIREVNLTHQQQEDFFPLYTAMEKEIYEINKKAREIEKKISNSTTSISDAEYQKTAEELLNVKMNEANIEAEYFHKFQKILSGKQLFLLKRAEMRFTRNMLEHHKGAARK